MKLRHVRRVLVLLLVITLAVTVAYGKGKSPKINLKAYSQFVEKMLKEWKVPGTAIVIVKDGKVVLSRGYGYRDVGKKLPVTPDTLFAIGSCTKAFTATLLGILADEGKLDWNKPVREYLPGFSLKDPVATLELTPADLLSHNSGLPRHDLTWYNSSASRSELVARMAHLEPNHSFRSRYQYNNLMVMIAGYMAGEINGTSWEELVTEKLLLPLGMKNTNLSVEASKKSSDFAWPYSIRDDKVAQVPFRNIDTIGPAGSINSSVKEMTNWLLLNLSKGKFADKQIISSKNLNKIHTPQIVMGNLSKFPELFYNMYALGWAVSNYRGHALITHTGGIDGFGAMVTFMPRENAGIVILTNTDTGSNQFNQIVQFNAIDRIVGKKPAPWAKRSREGAEKARVAAKKAQGQEDKNRKKGTQPSHKLEAYTGNYQDPGYGIITFEIKGGKLMGTYNNLQLAGEHYHYDIFEFTVDGMGGTKMRGSFGTGGNGEISTFAIGLQGGVKPIEFTRVPEKKKKD